MDYKKLGNSELIISRIGYGCMSLVPDEKESIPLLHKAIEMGINFLDTADIYNDGVNEIIVGKAVKDIRDKIIIASKAGNQRRPDGGLDWNPTKKYILQCVESSLKRLQTEYIDLYQLHGGTIDDNIDETIETFELLKRQGKIRYYGISSIRPNVIREYVKRSSIVSVMMQYSLLDRRPEEECLQLLQDHNIGVLTRGSLAQGLLSGKKSRDYLDSQASDVSAMAEAVNKLSSSERSPAQTALKYVLQNKAVTSAVVGMRTIDQLKEAIGTFERKDLEEHEMQSLADCVPALKYAIHR